MLHFFELSVQQIHGRFMSHNDLCLIFCFFTQSHVTLICDEYVCRCLFSVHINVKSYLHLSAHYLSPLKQSSQVYAILYFIGNSVFSFHALHKYALHCMLSFFFLASSLPTQSQGSLQSNANKTLERLC